MKGTHQPKIHSDSVRGPATATSATDSNNKADPDRWLQQLHHPRHPLHTATPCIPCHACVRPCQSTVPQPAGVAKPSSTRCHRCRAVLPTRTAPWWWLGWWRLPPAWARPEACGPRCTSPRGKTSQTEDRRQGPATAAAAAASSRFCSSPNETRVNTNKQKVP